MSNPACDNCGKRDGYHTKGRDGVLKFFTTASIKRYFNEGKDSFYLQEVMCDSCVRKLKRKRPRILKNKLKLKVQMLEAMKKGAS